MQIHRQFAENCRITDSQTESWTAHTYKTTPDFPRALLLRSYDRKTPRFRVVPIKTLEVLNTAVTQGAIRFSLGGSFALQKIWRGVFLLGAFSKLLSSMPVCRLEMPWGKLRDSLFFCIDAHTEAGFRPSRISSSSLLRLSDITNARGN